MSHAALGARGTRNNATIFALKPPSRSMSRNVNRNPLAKNWCYGQVQATNATARFTAFTSIFASNIQFVAGERVIVNGFNLNGGVFDVTGTDNNLYISVNPAPVDESYVNPVYTMVI